MSRRLVWAFLLAMLAGLPARAQTPFASDLVPTRTALSRLGLERQWMAVIPVVGDERVLSVSMSDNLIFVQTNKAYFHTMDAETGQVLWTARLGSQTAKAQGASVNSFGVFVTNLNTLFALDRKTGHTIWTEALLGTLPSSSTACDEDRVMVGLANGKIYGYALKERINKETTQTKVSDHAVEVWNWQTSGPVMTRPLPAARVVAFGSNDGKVYVAFADERTMLYRIATGGAIGAGLGSFGPRLLLIPSEDRILYAVDILTSEVKWTFPSGSPIAQEPLVANDDIFMVNTSGEISSIDPKNGSARWTTRTQGGRMMCVGAKKVYLESDNGDLFIINRENGQMIVSPRASLERAGLNIRNFDLGTTNRINDRLYLATSSGMLICVREIGQTKPRLLRDPKAIPFGTVPAEGVSLTPPPTVVAPPEEKAAETTPAAEKPAAEVPAPAPKPEKPPAGDTAPPPAENPK